MVSFDGAGGLDYEEQRDSGTLGPDGFFRAESEGFSARRLEVVTPSLTAVSHASISAGAPPSLTGIVSNLFQPAGSPIGTRSSGFDAESETEMLWEAATRQGKRVAVLAWPGVSQRSDRTRSPLGFPWTEAESPSALYVGPTSDIPLLDSDFALPLEARSFSPPKALRLPRNEKPGAPLLGEPPLLFVVVDGTDDGRRNYDQILAIDSRGGLRASARAGDWFPLTFVADEHAGARNVLFGRWCRLLSLSPDLSTISLYIGSLARNRAFPDDLRRTIDRRAGFWPGPPDQLLLDSNRFDTQSFADQATRLSEYLTEVFRAIDRRGDWDLLLAYQPMIDEGLHVFTLKDPRQPWFTPERSERARAAMREVWKAADRAAAAYLSFRSRGDVIFVSDHGMRAMTHSILLGEFLRRHGWLKTETGPKGEVRVAPGSLLDFAVSGGTGFITLNLAGRNPGGVVPADQAADLVRAVTSSLRALSHENGDPAFQAVLPVAEAASLGLAHRNASDIVVIAAGSTALRAGFASRPGDPIIGPAEIPGQHGFGPDPALDGIFFHVGQGIGQERVPSFPATGVAARVAERLGISPPGARPKP